MRNIFGILFILSLAITASFSAQAKGHKKYKKHPDAYRYVHAKSQYDATKSVVAPVRHARLGDQVLVPEKGWTYCEYNCRYTLQKEHLDFWEGLHDGVSPGILNRILKRLHY